MDGNEAMQNLHQYENEKQFNEAECNWKKLLHNENAITQRAILISVSLLCYVKNICEHRNINRKELAEMIGTSSSYITQLFRGDKIINLEMIARFEKALNIKFDIKLK